MSDARNNAAFVLVHGAWHNAEVWNQVVSELVLRGHAAVTLDLPGAGANAAVPDSFNLRPLDPATFGTEPSPNAGVTQEERTNATIEAVRQAAGEGNGQVILVGHSLGGLTVTPTAEAIPDELTAAVYLTAFMLPAGTTALDVIQHDTMADAVVPSLFMADPAEVGAVRLDVGSADAAYLQGLRDAFYGDLSDGQFEAAIGRLHPDEPVAVFATASTATVERFGTVDRHYIRCTQDRAITPAGQQFMIEAMDSGMPTRTALHEMETSHSPFYSDPVGVASILASIAGS